MTLASLLPFFAPSEALPFTFDLAIGVNGGNNRFGRGRAGGFGTFTPTNPEYTDQDGNTATVWNFQHFDASPSQYLLSFALGAALPPARIEIALSGSTDVEIWTTPTVTVPTGGTVFYTMSGDAVLVAGNVGSTVTATFIPTV